VHGGAYEISTQRSPSGIVVTQRLLDSVSSACLIDETPHGSGTAFSKVPVSQKSVNVTTTRVQETTRGGICRHIPNATEKNAANEIRSPCP
jgi:hypothetical protein